MVYSEGDEALFRVDLAAILKEELKDELAKRNLAVEENAKVLYDLTATVENGRFEPRFGFLEQDILVFSEARVDPHLAPYFRMTMDFTKVRIPYLVIETKYKGIASHSLMTNSNIAFASSDSSR